MNFQKLYRLSGLIVLLAFNQPVLGQDRSHKVLVVETTEPLSAEARVLLSRLVDDRALESYISAPFAKKNSETIKEICNNRDCSPALISPTIPAFPFTDVNVDVEVKNVGRIPFLQKQKNIGRLSGVEFELDVELLQKAAENRTILAYTETASIDPAPPSVSHGVFDGFAFASVVNKDIDRLAQGQLEQGFSKVQFRLPEGQIVDQKLLKDFVKLSNASAKEANETSEVTWLQNEKQGPCPASTVDAINEWPYSINNVSSLLKKNHDIMEKYSLDNSKRTRILIIDSGVGQTLHDGILSKFLPKYFRENLYIDKYYTGNGAQDFACSSNFDKLNLFQSDGFPTHKKYKSEKCGSTRSQRLAPLEGISLFDYSASHGSFVGVLGIGGPSLIEKHPNLTESLELDFARITSKTNNGRVFASENDLGSALLYAKTSNSDIMNLSLRVTDNSGRLLNHIYGNSYSEPPKTKYKGLIVAAAGNSGNKIIPADKTFPAASINQGSRAENLLVVAATEKNEGTIKLWPYSSYSDEIVDIAAPGSNIPSYDHNGILVCSSGTSAAAPIVTFTSSMLISYGLQKPNSVSRRILATSDIKDDLKDKIIDGRVLNISNALNIFSDQIWVSGEENARNGFILPWIETSNPQSRQEFSGGAYPLCRSAISSSNHKEWMDLSQIQYWKAIETGKSEIWVNSGETRKGQSCMIDPETQLHFYDELKNEVESIQLTNIDRFVPSPFRKIIKQRFEAAISR